ncbi:MAG: AAA family ATPase [Chloroflexi bacterium]|nr:AAA family ATPase [Chloroflexota bacterium]MCL5075670.1 AAA family ATPase [Chloroflexota bacterium]
MEEVPIEKLRRVCDPQCLGFQTTAELESAQDIIGQERAVRSLQFGLGIQEQGFNIYVSGIPGTGRTTAVRSFLERLARDKAVPPDWCYVNNFREPYRPKALRLPSGWGKQLQRDVRRLIEGARITIPKAFEGEEYAAKREEIVTAFQRQRGELFTRLDDEARQEGFVIQSTPMGLLIIPVVNGKPLSDQEFMSLSAEAKETIAKKRERLETELKAAVRQVRGWEKDSQEQLRKLDQQVVLNAVGHLIADLIEKYKEFPEVVTYLHEVQEDIVENFAQFRPEAEPQPSSPLPTPWLRELAFRKYEVNVVVDNAEAQGAPVVIALNPTYTNLFGRIEKEAQLGALVTDFTLIKGGSLHKANGGYLVLPVEDVLRNIFSWDALKRALRNNEIVVEEVGERLGFVVTKSLIPEPIPLEAKVILIGSPLLYHLLYTWDEDFNELFKVRADFDSRMDWTEKNVRDYATFICTLCHKENLKQMENSAVAKVVEYAARLAEDQKKLSTKFAETADIIREATFWATQDGSPYVTSAHVQRAIEEKVYRASLIQERIQEMIERGTIMIDIAGEAVGQVNGLSVIDMGDFSFGRPVRISTSIGLGREGIIDIEREAKLGGRIHTKGMLILSGYLANKYAQNKPLTLAARVVFEQSYEEVEGDSASSAELYALLSHLSGLPIKQGLAITGSVNQKGEIQAIGGVNQKIEGFFDVCRAKGLSGEQGALIPQSNVKNLMLREDVVEAAKKGQFHIYPVQTIDQGVSILTGVEAGQMQEDGKFPEGTVNARVDHRLREMAEGLRGYLREEKPEAKTAQEG